jgi:hypothetical protein
MATYQPCFGCTQRMGCEIKEAIAKAMRGQPISKIHVRCDLPFTKFFPPGTRVSVEVWDWSERDEPSGTFVPATVIGRSTKKRGRLLVHLDKMVSMATEQEIEFTAKWPKDVHLLDEPLAALCDVCNRPLVNGGCNRHDDIMA